MNIKKLIVKSFGKLKDVSIEFNPGLNIIYGKNEAGKSTLQAFIKGMFYGLRKKGKKGEISEFERYTPWNNSEFSGSIEYDIDGTEYKVNRNFITNKVTVSNEFWEDISGLFPLDKKSGLQFAEKHIGLSEDCFENTTFIRQLGSKIENEKELVDKLINVQETGNEDVSYKKALEILENALKDKIGSEKTSKKPINIIDLEIEQLQKDKYDSIIIRNEIAEIEEKIKINEESKSLVVEQLDGLNNTKQLIKKENLLGMYNKSKDYENAIEKIDNEISRLYEFENFPIHLEDKLKELIIKIQSRKDSANHKKIRLDEIDEKQASLQEFSHNQDIEEMYKAISNFELMKQLIIQKDEYQARLNKNTTELDKLEDAKNTTSDNELAAEAIELETNKITIENKLIAINKLMPQVNKIIHTDHQDNNVSFEDIQNTLIKYKSLVELNEKISLTKREIARFEQDIYTQEEIIDKLGGYKNLPDDIEDIVMNLQESLADNRLLNVENNSAVNKLNRYQFGVNIILFFISCGLFSYGIYNIVSGLDSIAYLISAIGLVSTITFLIKTISSLKSIFSLMVSKSVKTSQPQENNYESAMDALSKIYSSVGTSDFTNFMKQLYTYKDAMQKLKMLNLDLNLKNQHIESMYYEIDKVEKEISDILNEFNIEHDSNSITELDIAKLQDRLNKTSDYLGYQNDRGNISGREELVEKLSEILEDDEVELENVEIICNRLNERLAQINNRIIEIYSELDVSTSSELIEKLELRSNTKNKVGLINEDNERIKDTIYKLIERIVSTDKNIKEVLTKNNIDFDSEKLIEEISINNLKEKMSENNKLTTEVKSTEIIIHDLLEEIKEIEDAISNLEHEKKEILEEAMCENENDFFSFCEKKRSLIKFIDEKKRLESMHFEILNGENSEILLQKISQIEGINNIDHIKYQEDVEGEIELLNNKLKIIDEETISLKNQQKFKLEKAKDLNEIVEKIEWLNIKKQSLIDNKEAIEIAMDVLKESSKELQREFSPRLQREISDIISQITSGKYNEVRTNEKLNINVNSPEVGLITGVENLSVGTIEQFYLSLRIALSNVLSTQSSNLPIIIDEGFVQYDDDRIKNVINFLIRLSTQRQIIIFTCQSRELEIIKNLGFSDNVNVVELSKIYS